MPQNYFGAPAHLKRAAVAPQLHPSVPVQAPSEAQARCDAVQAEFRAQQQQAEPQRRSIRRDPPPLPPALVSTDDALMQRLAEELEYARRMLEQMGDTLSADPAVIARHMVSLQSVDIIGQILGHIANVVRSSKPKDMVELIGMCELKARLTRRSLT